VTLVYLLLPEEPLLLHLPAKELRIEKKKRVGCNDLRWLVQPA
jgi:hypothetical protein